jgi:hypothetical protein
MIFVIYFKRKIGDAALYAIHDQAVPEVLVMAVKRVCIASTNPVKAGSIVDAFSKSFPGESFEFIKGSLALLRSW